MSTYSTKMQKSAEIIAANEDLLTQILLRLPIKSLFRFKCVSTQWLQIISSHYFSKKHTHKNPNPLTSALLLHHYPSLTHINLVGGPDIRHSRPSFGPVPVYDFVKIPPHYSNLTILSSCNGLLLCLLLASTASEPDMLYIVCNPTTKKSSPLPPFADLVKKPIVNIDLAFDPRDSPDYKVVCVRHCTPPFGPDFEIQIFSSETGLWKTCRSGGLFFYFRIGMLYRGGVYCSRRMHYLDSTNDDTFCFDVDDETMRSIEMPPMQSEVITSRRSWYLGQSGGYLHLVDIETNITRDSAIVIYELKQDYTGWVVRFQVGLWGLVNDFPEMIQYVDAWPDGEMLRVGRYYIYYVLGLVRGQGGDVYELVLSIPNKIVCYNVGDGAWRAVAYFRDDRDRRGYDWHNVVLCANTLSPV